MNAEGHWARFAHNLSGAEHICAHGFSSARRRILHLRQRIRHQPPRVIAGYIGGVRLPGCGVDTLARGRGHLDPVAARAGLLPAPVEVRGVQLFAGACGHVLPTAIGHARNRNLARLNLYLPAFGRTDGACVFGFALEKKRGAVAHLRYRRVDAEVPHRGRNQVVASLQVGSQVVALVAPVGQVAARRAIAHAFAVYIKDEAIVGADAHDVAGEHGIELDRAAEVQHQRLAQRSGGVRDPLGMPGAAGRVGRLRNRYGESKGKGGESGKTTRGNCHGEIQLQSLPDGIAGRETRAPAANFSANPQGNKGVSLGIGHPRILHSPRRFFPRYALDFAGL